jgi:hypothetical protein
MDKPTPTSITKRLMSIPGFTAKGFANLVGQDQGDAKLKESLGMTKGAKRSDKEDRAQDNYGLSFN